MVEELNFYYLELLLKNEEMMKSQKERTPTYEQGRWP